MDSSPTFQPMRKTAKKRYEHILATAREIILEQRSLSPLSIHRLAEETGISRVSIYYFFDSTNQVLQVLYDQARDDLQHSVASTVTSESLEWKQIVARVMNQVIDYYHENPVAMILSLTPVCFEEVNQQNRAYAMALHRHLVTQSIWEDDQQTLFTCEIAMDLVDAVLRKSFIQHGSITEYYHQQALIAFTAYFEAAAIKSSVSNNTKVEIL